RLGLWRPVFAAAGDDVAILGRERHLVGQVDVGIDLRRRLWQAEGGIDCLIKHAALRLTAVTENGVTDGETSPPAGADTGTSGEGTATLAMSEQARSANAAEQGSVTAGETAPLPLDQADAIILAGDADKTPLAV